MNGPYDFDESTLDKEIIHTQSGSYALGHLDLQNNFIIEYVGKSDSDIRGRLRKHMPSSYKMFKFRYAISQKTSHLKEVAELRDYCKSGTNEIHRKEINVAV